MNRDELISKLAGSVPYKKGADRLGFYSCFVAASDVEVWTRDAMGGLISVFKGSKSHPVFTIYQCNSTDGLYLPPTGTRVTVHLPSTAEICAVEVTKKIEKYFRLLFYGITVVQYSGFTVRQTITPCVHTVRPLWNCEDFDYVLHKSLKILKLSKAPVALDKFKLELKDHDADVMLMISDVPTDCGRALFFHDKSYLFDAPNVLAQHIMNFMIIIIRSKNVMYTAPDQDMRRALTTELYKRVPLALITIPASIYERMWKLYRESILQMLLDVYDNGWRSTCYWELLRFQDVFSGTPEAICTLVQYIKRASAGSVIATSIEWNSRNTLPLGCKLMQSLLERYKSYQGYRFIFPQTISPRPATSERPALKTVPILPPPTPTVSGRPTQVNTLPPAPVTAPPLPPPIPPPAYNVSTFGKKIRAALGDHPLLNPNHKVFDLIDNVIDVKGEADAECKKMMQMLECATLLSSGDKFDKEKTDSFCQQVVKLVTAALEAKNAVLDYE